MAGTITSMGLGSGLDLQNILDQLKEVDRSAITRKENEKQNLTKEINAYNSLNAKLFSMKNDALSLSLESNFMKTKGVLSDESILSASVDDGVQENSHSIEVVQKAQQNSWQTAGVSSEDAQIYAEPATSIASAEENVTTASETMTIQYGAAGKQQDIDISLSEDMSLSQIANAINDSSSNRNGDGDQLVSASVKQNNDGNFYIRLGAANGGNSADSQISISGYDYVKADTTISVAVADGSDPAYVSLAPGTTYSQTADLINNSENNPGVTASIINDGSSSDPYRLVLVSDKTGEENRMSIGNLSMTEITGEAESLNAVLKVNGITYNRQSNSGIDDVIPGATLNLKKAGETSLGIQKQTDSIKENIQSFVKGFNEVVNEINGNESSADTDSENTDESNPLSDSYTIKGLTYELASLVGTTVSNGSAYSSLYDIGVSTNKDGTLSLDETQLDQALAADPEAVQSLFISDSENDIKGLGDVLNNGLSRMVSSRGVLTTEIDQAEERIDRIEADIETATERLDQKYETMTRKFAEMDSYINELNSQADAMSSIFESYSKGSSSDGK